MVSEFQEFRFTDFVQKFRKISQDDKMSGMRKI